MHLQPKLYPGNMECRPKLEITSYESGKIYINDQYTGLSTPNSIQLTPGTYKVGLGIDNGTNQPKYLEKKVSINNGAKEIKFFSNDSSIINRNVVKIGSCRYAQGRAAECQFPPRLPTLKSPR